MSRAHTTLASNSTGTADRSGRRLDNVNKKSFIRFLLVGGAATILQYVIMAALIYSIGLNAVVASTTGYIVSSAFNYLASAYFTFQNEGSHWQGVPRFLIMLGTACVINVVVLYVLTSIGLPVVLSQIIATGVVFIWNYMISAIWAFRS